MTAKTSDPDTFVFDTTHHAIWAEEVAEERGIPAEVVPAPPEAKASCMLALRTFPDRVPDLVAAFSEEGIRFRIHSPDG